MLAEAKTKIDVKQSPLALPYACELLGQNSDAENYYLDAMKAAPGDQRIQRAIVEFHARTGKIDEAESLLRQMIAAAGEANDAATLQWSRRTLAGLLINSPAYQKHVEARKLIDKNLDAFPKSDADLRMSALVDASLTTKESRQRAIENLELLSQRPGVLTLDDHLVLAKLYWSAGEGAKARDQLRTLATQGRSAQYTLAYAEVLLEEKEYSEAENWVRRLEELAPTEFGTATIRARLFARKSVTTRPTIV